MKENAYCVFVHNMCEMVEDMCVYIPVVSEMMNAVKSESVRIWCGISGLMFIGMCCVKIKQK